MLGGQVRLAYGRYFNIYYSITRKGRDKWMDGWMDGWMDVKDEKGLWYQREERNGMERESSNSNSNSTA